MIDLDSPNVLYLTVDSLRSDRVTAETMPWTAHLAKKGVSFDRMYATAPATAASFLALMTSRYYSDVDGIGLPDETFTTLAEAFAGNGYATHGRSTNKFTSSYYNYDRGFDTFDSPSDSLKFAIRRHLDEDGALFRLLEWGYHHWLQFSADGGGEGPSWWNRPAGVVNEEMRRGPLSADGSSPWFAWLHHMEPHHPLEPPADYLPASVGTRAQAQELTRTLPGELTGHADMDRVRSLYDAECRYWDDEFRNLHQSVPDDTLVVIVGDHGELLGEHDRYGHPHEMWRELTNVPCIIYHPDLPAATIDTLQTTLDLPPTILSLAGIYHPSSMRGRAIDIPEDDGRNRVYGTIETSEHVGMVRSDEWTWLRHESRHSTQDNQGELLAPGGRQERREAMQRHATDHRDVCRDYREDFALTVGEPPAAEGNRMTDEQVQQHMRDLGYLDQR